MKKLFTSIVLGTVLVVTGCVTQNPQNESMYQYPFKTAKIEYAIKGTTEGNATLTIKGDKSIRESHVIYHKPTGDEKQDNLFIDTGKYNYSIDLNKKIGSMTPNPFYGYFIALDPSQRQGYLRKIAIGIAPDRALTQESKSSGTEVVAGQTCELHDMEGIGVVCLWNGIAIKTSINLPDYGLTNNRIATSIQTDVDVPDSVFDVPEGITIRKAGIIDEAALSTPSTAQTTGQTQQ